MSGAGELSKRAVAGTKDNSRDEPAGQTVIVVIGRRQNAKNVFWKWKQWLKTPPWKHRNNAENPLTTALMKHKHTVSKNSKQFRRLTHDQSTENQSDPHTTPPMNYGTPRMQGLMNLTVLALF
jgi:hypothetical protein